MSFAIIRIHKHKHLASIAGVARHHSREIDCPTADASRQKNNVRLGLQKARQKTLAKASSLLLMLRKKKRHENSEATQLKLSNS